MENNNNSQEKEKLTRVNNVEEIKQDDNLLIAPSINIVKFLIDTVAENGIHASVFTAKSKDDEDVVCIQAQISMISTLKDVLENEQVFKIEKYGDNTECVEENKEE